MAIELRECAGIAQFNTGSSKCLLDPGKVKAIILTMHGYKLPANATAELLEAACHDDRPNRIFPIKTIIEYAPSGGEANKNATGYGPNKITSYSAKDDVWTVDEYDASLKANIMAAKGVAFDAYFVDENNVVYGMNDGTDILAGIPLAGIYPGGQDWDSSGTEANLTVGTMFKDYEKYVKNADYRVYKFDVVEALKGLVYVELVKLDTGENNYKLKEHFGNLDVTSFFGAALSEGASSCFDGEVSAVKFENGNLVITATGTPSLKSPKVLQKNGIVGIEQWKA